MCCYNIQLFRIINLYNIIYFGIITFYLYEGLSFFSMPNYKDERDASFIENEFS